MGYDKLVDSIELETKLKSIGDAIREKTGKHELIAVDDMPNEIRGITSGSNEGLYCWRVSDEKFAPLSLVPKMTSNIDNGYEIFASSYTNNSEAYKAFDAIGTNTKWLASSSVPQYIGVHFPSAVTVSSFSILNVNEENRAIKDFYLQGSDDGENWIDFGFYTNPSSANNKEYFYVNTPASKKYWRLYISSSSIGTYARAASIEFYSEMGSSFIVSDNPNAHPKDGFAEDGKYYTLVGKQDIQLNIPDEYQQVEYIRGTGTQYIKTGLIPLAYEIKTKIENGSGKAGQHGAIEIIPISTQSSDVYRRSHCGKYDSNILNINDVNCLIPSDTDIHTYKYDGMNVFFDNENVDSPIYHPSKIEFYLFCRNKNNTIDNFVVGNIYYFKTWNQANELTGYFIPVYRKSDNVIGMYDFITKMFFVNDGTGVFLKGNDI